MVVSSHRLSPSSQPELPLADGFREPSHEQWQRQVEKILRDSGRLAEDEPTPEAVEDLLATTTYDGITVHPLYTSGTGASGDSGYPGLAPFVRGSRAQGCVAEGWDVRQPYPHPNPATANERILADLNGGATSVWLELGSTGLAVDDLGDALHDVHLDLISICLDAGAEFTAAAEALWALARDRGIAPGALHGNLGADPIGVRARTGQMPDGAVDLAARCSREYGGMRALVADGLPYHDAGGSDAEELGCSLAAATTYLRWLTEPAPEGAGLDIDTACGLLEFRYAATCDQFSTIAKLRAARQLWERVTRECGASEAARAQAQHAVTSSAMLTRRDPWVNILRTTIATFAAGVGGAQAVTVRPFDAAIGLPDALAHRVARNTSALLLEETRLTQVIDPAGGSWYVESLTDELAHAAWSWFQRIEEEGGLPAALDSGLVSERLATTWQQRREAIAHRRDPVIGVSEYPNLDESPPRREPYPPRPSGGLPEIRYAEDFEQLRDAADEQLAETGSRPKVFLATLGPLATHTARASFAKNLFSAGGLDTPEAGITESAQDVLDAYSEVDTPVVCLCSNDRTYDERAEETARALRAAGASRVLLAGKPRQATESVDDVVFDGCDAVATLRDTHSRLGVRK